MPQMPSIAWEHPRGRPSCRVSNARIHHSSASPPTHRTELIDGKSIAEDIRKELKAEVEQLKAKYGKVGRQALRLIGGGGGDCCHALQGDSQQPLLAA